MDLSVRAVEVWHNAHRGKKTMHVTGFSVSSYRSRHRIRFRARIRYRRRSRSSFFLISSVPPWLRGESSPPPRPRFRSSFFLISSVPPWLRGESSFPLASNANAKFAR